MKEKNRSEMTKRQREEEVGLVGSGSGDVRTLEVVVVDLCPSAEGKKEGKGKRREQGTGKGSGSTSTVLPTLNWGVRRAGAGRIGICLARNYAR